MSNPVNTAQIDNVTGIDTLQRSIGGAAMVSAQFSSRLPTGAVSLNASSGNVANAAAVATFAAVGGKTNYVTAFEITGAGATAASVVVATLDGILGGTMSYVVAVPAGAVLGLSALTVHFTDALPASAVNIAASITLPALGLGNTNAAVALHGYQI